MDNRRAKLLPFSSNRRGRQALPWTSSLRAAVTNGKEHRHWCGFLLLFLLCKLVLLQDYVPNGLRGCTRSSALCNSLMLGDNGDNNCIVVLLPFPHRRIDRRILLPPAPEKETNHESSANEYKNLALSYVYVRTLRSVRTSSRNFTDVFLKEKETILFPKSTFHARRWPKQYLLPMNSTMLGY